MTRTGTLTYNGFTNAVCECDYIIEQSGDRYTVILIQTPKSKTSVTNMVEVLASKILAHELVGVNPSMVDFYEYYDPAMKPLYVMQRVSFKDAGIINPPGLWGKMLGIVSAKHEQAFAVDTPAWNPVSQEEHNKVSALIKDNPF